MLDDLFIVEQGLAEAKETGDSQKFTDAVAEYDSLTRLDAWKTQLLLRVKKRLSAVADGEEEDLT
jgi:alpha-soluble NSF attachment protein